MKFLDVLKSLNEIEEKKIKKNTNIFLVWPYIKVYLFGRYKKNNPTSQPKENKILFYSLWAIKSVLKFKFKTIFKSKEIMFIYSQRYDKSNEIYLDRIRDEINLPSCSFSFSQNGKFIGEHCFLDVIKIFIKIVTKLYIKYGFYREKYVAYSELIFSVDEVISGSGDYVKELIVEYNFWYFFYKFILKEIAPKEIYLVGGIYFAPMIKVAKELGIRTIEVQHGIINSKHVAYNWDGWLGDGFFCDELWMLSKKWSNSAVYPEKTCLKVIGNDFYYREIKRVIECNRVLFISSDINGDIIADIAINISNNKKNKVVFRYHPKENIKPSLESMVLISNESLTYEMSRAQFIISASSTVVYEALDLGIPVIILDFGESYFSSVMSNNILGIVYCLDNDLDSICNMIEFFISLGIHSENMLNSDDRFFSPFVFPARTIGGL